MSVALYRGANTVVRSGGAAVFAMYGPLGGGIIVNPSSPDDQGIAVAEPLFIDITGADAVLQETVTSVPIQPGQSITIPAQTTSVSVNAATSGHRFTAIVYQDPVIYPPVQQAGSFPPTGATTRTETIESYLYQQYNDDADLQAFVDSFNALAQVYVGWFAEVPLPVYTDDNITGTLLDWVAQGLYGMARPSLSSGQNRDIGPLNTYTLNQLTLNGFQRIAPQDVTITDDDIFKRCLTWNFYKGDGNIFNILWLKRRVMRFLIGTNGSAPNIDDTSGISVSVANHVITISLTVGTRTVTGGALLNAFALNTVTLNSMQSSYQPPPNPLPNETVFRDAVESGVLIFPFQYDVVVRVP